MATARTCCSSPTWRAAMRADDRRTRGTVRDRQAQRAALGDPGGYARRLFGARADGPRETNPRYHASSAASRPTGCPSWSTPASTCAASRSSARRRTRSDVSWAPTSTCSSSGIRCFEKEGQDPNSRSLTKTSLSWIEAAGCTPTIGVERQPQRQTYRRRSRKTFIPTKAAGVRLATRESSFCLAIRRDPSLHPNVSAPLTKLQWPRPLMLDTAHSTVSFSLRAGIPADALVVHRRVPSYR